MWMGLHGLNDVTRTYSQTLGSAFSFFKKFILKFIYLAVPGLSCGMQTLSCCMCDLVPGPGIKPRPPVLGAQSLRHWTMREIPVSFILRESFFKWYKR